jgi:hypothetical protein
MRPLPWCLHVSNTKHALKSRQDEGFYFWPFSFLIIPGHYASCDARPAPYSLCIVTSSRDQSKVVVTKYLTHTSSVLEQRLEKKEGLHFLKRSEHTRLVERRGTGTSKSSIWISPDLPTSGNSPRTSLSSLLHPPRDLPHSSTFLLRVWLTASLLYISSATHLHRIAVTCSTRLFASSLSLYDPLTPSLTIPRIHAALLSDLVFSASSKSSSSTHSPHTKKLRIGRHNHLSSELSRPSVDPFLDFSLFTCE